MKKMCLPSLSIIILASLVYFSASAEIPQTPQTPQTPENPTLGSSWVRDFLAQNTEYQDMPITERTEKSITFQRSDGQLVTQAVDFPIHYKDARGQWQPLDTTLKFYSETGEWGAPGFETGIKPNGEVSIYPVRSRSSLMTDESQGDSASNGVYTQKTVGYGNLNSETGEFSTLGEFQGGNANGDTLVRYAGDIEHKIKLTDLGVKEEMILPSAPAGISESDYLVMKTEIGSEKLFADGWLEDADLTEYHLPAPFSFDANQKTIPTKRYTQYLDGIQYVYTGVKVSSLVDSQFPVTIDPDYLDSTNDGYVYGLDHATALGVTIAADILFVGATDDGEGTQYYSRDFLKFDTSAIPDGNTVTQVNLKMVCMNDGSTVDFDVDIVKQDWSAQDPLSSGNMEAAYDNCLAGTLDDNIWRNTLGIAINTQYASGNLNTAWVSKTGNTYYSLISSRDKAEINASSNEYMYLASQDHATVAYRPILTVVHAPPPPRPLYELFYNVKLFQNVKFFYTP